MKTNIKVSGIVIFGVLLSFVLPNIITQSTTNGLEEKKQVVSKKETKTNSDSIAMAERKDTAVPVETQPAQVEEEKKEETEVIEEPKQEAPVPQPVTPVLTKSYDELTTEELIDAINTGAYKLEHSKAYEASTNKFSKSKGAIHYEDHKETYYSQNVLPGTSLNIPGRHVAEDGTVRDGDGYICVAANSSYLSKGTVVKTSMGPAKVYDTGCASGIIDIYTNW